MQVVLAQDTPHLLLGVSALQQAFGHLGQLLGLEERGQRLLIVCPVFFPVCFEEAGEAFDVVDEVDLAPDMLGTYPVGSV